MRLGLVFTDCVRFHFLGGVLGDGCVDACLGFGGIVIAIFRCKEIVNDFDPISGLNQPGAILPANPVLRSFIITSTLPPRLRTLGLGQVDVYNCNCMAAGTVIAKSKAGMIFLFCSIVVEFHFYFLVILSISSGLLHRAPASREAH